MSTYETTETLETIKQLLDSDRNFYEVLEASVDIINSLSTLTQVLEDTYIKQFELFCLMLSVLVKEKLAQDNAQ